MATNIGSGTKTKKTAVNSSMTGSATSGGVDVGGTKKPIKQPEGPGFGGMTGTDRPTTVSDNTPIAKSPVPNASGLANDQVTGKVGTASVAAPTAVTGPQGTSNPNSNPYNISGYNQGTTDPLTGYMAQFGYTPQGLGNLYSNPNQLAGDVLGTLGINNAGLAGQFGDYMNPALFANLLLNGGQGRSLNDNDALNFVAQYMQQMGTPGGRTPQLDVLFNKILGAAGQGQGTPLYDYFNYDPSSGQALSPTDQVKVANQAFGQAMTSMNPLAQRAYAAMLAEQGQQYQQGLNKGQDMGPDYLSYLNTTGLPGYIRR